MFAYVKYRENQSIFNLNVRKDGEISSSINVEKLFESSSTPNRQVQNTPNTQTYTEPISVDASACQIVSSFDTVNLRQNCDTNDCQNDPATIATRISNGETVKVLGRKVSGTNFDWIEIEVAGGQYYVASSKLSCFLSQ